MSLLICFVDMFDFLMKGNSVQTNRFSGGQRGDAPAEPELRRAFHRRLRRSVALSKGSSTLKRSSEPPCTVFAKEKRVKNPKRNSE